MTHHPPSPPLIAILGCTASGKTGISLRLAERFAAEIVSVDSAQVYRGLDVGTAKPTAQELARVPHHLIDLREPDKAFSVAEFVELARLTLGEIQRRNRLPILVGGTGLYMRALLEGYQLVEAPPDPELRRRLSAASLKELHDELAELDSAALEIVDLQNPRRVQRALEVCLTTGGRFSDFYRKRDPGYRSFKLGLRWGREELVARIRLRTEQMFDQGWLEEVLRLKENGHEPFLRQQRIIGYTEILDHLKGEFDLAECRQRILQSTLRLAKKQRTWLKKESSVHWYDLGADGVTERLFEEMVHSVERFLGSSE